MKRTEKIVVGVLTVVLLSALVASTNLIQDGLVRVADNIVNATGIYAPVMNGVAVAQSGNWTDVVRLCGSSYKAVEIPCGTYAVSDSSDSCVITTHKDVYGQNMECVEITPSVDMVVFNFTGASFNRATIRDLSILSSNGSGIGLFMKGGQHVAVKRLRIENFTTGIKVWERAYFHVYEDLHVESNTDYGLWFHGRTDYQPNDNIVLGGKFKNNDKGDIYIGWGNNNVVIGTFFNTGGNTSIKIGGPHNNLTRGNVFRDIAVEGTGGTTPVAEVWGFRHTIEGYTQSTIPFYDNGTYNTFAFGDQDMVLSMGDVPIQDYLWIEPHDNLVSDYNISLYMKFNGNLNDDGPYGVKWGNTGPATYTSGLGGGELYCDGGTDRIYAFNANTSQAFDFENKTDFTIGFCYNDTSYHAANTYLLQKGTTNYFSVLQSSASTIRFRLDDGPDQVTSEWGGVVQEHRNCYLWEVDRDANMTLWVDGLQKDSDDISLIGNLTNTDLMYVCSDGSGANQNNMTIDELTVWKRLLPLEEKYAWFTKNAELQTTAQSVRRSGDNVTGLYEYNNPSVKNKPTIRVSDTPSNKAVMIASGDAFCFNTACTINITGNATYMNIRGPAGGHLAVC